MKFPATKAHGFTLIEMIVVILVIATLAALLVPAAFILASLALVGNTLVEKPIESALGLGIVALGLPAYAWWRRSSNEAGSSLGS